MLDFRSNWQPEKWTSVTFKWLSCVSSGILELQGWTVEMDPDSDWVMTALLVSCPQPRFPYVWPDFPWDICFRMFLQIMFLHGTPVEEISLVVLSVV